MTIRLRKITKISNLDSVGVNNYNDYYKVKNGVKIEYFQALELFLIKKFKFG